MVMALPPLQLLLRLETLRLLLCYWNGALMYRWQALAAQSSLCITQQPIVIH
jgi:hypothetical protein